MRKFCLIIFSLFIFLPSGAQGQINTKKFIISDFTEKTLNVVLSGNEMTDGVLRSEMPLVWHISPYEFCSMKEFSQRKKSPDYYFMVIGENNGIRYLTIYKGTDKAKEDLAGLYKVTSIPFSCSGLSWGDKIQFVPALINILQKDIEMKLEKTFNPTSIVNVRAENRYKKWGHLTIDADDLAFEANSSVIAAFGDLKVTINEDGLCSEMISERKADIVAGYVVAPENPVAGDICYTMAIDAQKLELMYIRKRIISGKTGRGFTKAELKALTRRISK